QSSGYVVRSQLFGFPIAIVADNGFPIAIVADNAGLNRINVRYPAPHPRHKPPSSGHRSVPASRASVLPKHDSANSPQRPIHFQPLRRETKVTINSRNSLMSSMPRIPA